MHHRLQLIRRHDEPDSIHGRHLPEIGLIEIQDLSQRPPRITRIHRRIENLGHHIKHAMSLAKTKRRVEHIYCVSA